MCLPVPNGFSLFTADDLQRVRPSGGVRLGCRPLNQKTIWRCQTDKRAQNRVHVTCEKLQYGHVWLMTTALSAASFICNNGHPVSDALHKSKRLPVCLPVGVGERSETAVSVPASCSLPLSVSLQPRLISAFQLPLILLRHCPLHKELGQTLPRRCAAGNFPAHCLLSLRRSRDSVCSR